MARMFNGQLPGAAGGGGGSGTGDVTGPASVTDEAVARWDGAGGDTLRDSVVTITDAGAVAGVTTINSTTIPSSKTLVVTTDKLSVLAATTSAELKGVISDETGSDALVFANTPTLVAPLLGTPTSGTLTNCTAPASIITSGTLVHERGGLEADVSAFAGLVKISGGATTQATAQTDFILNAERQFNAYSASYPHSFVPGLSNCTALTTFTFSANTLYAFPFLCPRNVSVVRDMRIRVTTGVAATNARLGIYESVGGFPDALVANSDSGDLDTATSATTRVYTPGATLTLVSGKEYWIAIHSSGAPAIQGIPLAGRADFWHDTATTSNYTLVSVAESFGAMPDPFTTGYVGVLDAISPIIYMRFTS